MKNLYKRKFPQTLNKANKVEKSWTNFKYSVNNEENKDNDETINRNNVKSEQFVTQLQNINGNTLKISETTTCANSFEQPKQPQLAARTTTNTEQKELPNLLLTRVRALFLLVNCAYPIALMEVLLKQTQRRN